MSYYLPIAQIKFALIKLISVLSFALISTQLQPGKYWLEQHKSCNSIAIPLQHVAINATGSTADYALQNLFRM